jgi:hypothetical protein
LEWARAHWPEDPPAGLEELTERLKDPAARRALVELDRRLYGVQEGDWDGGGLAKVIPRLPPRNPAGAVNDPLPELYP